jgi:hypothetical protein
MEESPFALRLTSFPHCKRTMNNSTDGSIGPFTVKEVRFVFASSSIYTHGEAKTSLRTKPVRRAERTYPRGIWKGFVRRSVS